MVARKTPAQYIKAVLKKYFPKDKFSCKYSSFSMWDAVDIYWTDWPSQEAVEKTVKRFQAGNFDSHTDCYEYNNTRTDIPQAKYVLCHRDVSNKIIEQVAKYYDSKLIWNGQPHMKALHVNDIARRICEQNYIPTGKKLVGIDTSKGILTFK